MLLCQRSSSQEETMVKMSDETYEMRSRLISIEDKLKTALGLYTNRSYQMINDAIGDPDQVYGCITYAQHAEDIVAACILEMIGIKKPSYLDIGAHHPTKISNTALLYMRGSRGINIEANPTLMEEFQKHRPDDINLNVGVSDVAGRMKFYRFDETSGLNTFDIDRARYVTATQGFRITSEIEVDVVTTAEIIDKYAGGEFPDYLSLDVEGLDFRILNSIPYEKYAPKLINVEANHDSDARKIANLLISKGYRPHFRMRGNLFFLQNKYTSASIPAG